MCIAGPRAGFVTAGGEWERTAKAHDSATRKYVRGALSNDAAYRGQLVQRINDAATTARASAEEELAKRANVPAWMDPEPRPAIDLSDPKYNPIRADQTSTVVDAIMQRMPDDGRYLAGTYKEAKQSEKARASRQPGSQAKSPKPAEKKAPSGSGGAGFAMPTAGVVAMPLGGQPRQAAGRGKLSRRTVLG